MAHFLKNNNQMRITRTRLLCEMQANSFWAEFLRIIFKFRKRQKILPSLVYVLHKTWNWAFSRRSRAVTVKKCTKKRDARAELLFCLFNQLLFWRSRCRRRRGILKSLVSCSALFKAFLNLTECKQRIWFLESGKFLFVESAILGFWIQNTAQESGIALNRTWNPESKFHWQRLESSTWYPESAAWIPESKTVLVSLTWGDQPY